MKNKWVNLRTGLCMAAAISPPLSLGIGIFFAVIAKPLEAKLFIGIPFALTFLITLLMVLRSYRNYWHTDAFINRFVASSQSKKTLSRNEIDAIVLGFFKENNIAFEVVQGKNDYVYRCKNVYHLKESDLFLGVFWGFILLYSEKRGNSAIQDMMKKLGEFVDSIEEKLEPKIPFFKRIFQIPVPLKRIAPGSKEHKLVLRGITVAAILILVGLALFGYLYKTNTFPQGSKENGSEFIIERALFSRYSSGDTNWSYNSTTDITSLPTLDRETWEKSYNVKGDKRNDYTGGDFIGGDFVLLKTTWNSSLTEGEQLYTVERYEPPQIGFLLSTYLVFIGIITAIIFGSVYILKDFFISKASLLASYLPSLLYVAGYWYGNHNPDFLAVLFFACFALGSSLFLLFIIDWIRKYDRIKKKRHLFAIGIGISSISFSAGVTLGLYFVLRYWNWWSWWNF